MDTLQYTATDANRSSKGYTTTFIYKKTVVYPPYINIVEKMAYALQIILELCIPEKELAKTHSQISFLSFQSHS